MPGRGTGEHPAALAVSRRNFAARDEGGRRNRAFDSVRVSRLGVCRRGIEWWIYPPTDDPGELLRQADYRFSVREIPTPYP